VERRVSHPDLSRVAVVGTSGSGKTSLARRLADSLGATHVELDAIHWGPGWSELPADELREAVAREIASDRWIVDGNYGRVRDMVWARATAVIWLNYPFHTVFSRAVARTARRVATGEEIFSGNRETFRAGFLSTDSIPWWVVKTFRSRRREYRQLFEGDSYPELAFIEFRRPREADEFLQRLSPGAR